MKSLWCELDGRAKQNVVCRDPPREFLKAGITFEAAPATVDVAEMTSHTTEPKAVGAEDTIERRGKLVHQPLETEIHHHKAKHSLRYGP